MALFGVRRCGAWASLGLAVAGLAGCVDTVAEFRSGGPAVASARNGLGNPRGASVALASLDGAPADVNVRFRQFFATAAGARGMVLAQNLAEITPAFAAQPEQSPAANYLVRGYLSAYPAPEGTAIGYVWDVFDATKHRARRVEDAILIKSTDADAWHLASDKVLASLAAKSVDDLVSFLASTPEALAYAGTPQPPTMASAIPALQGFAAAE